MDNARSVRPVTCWESPIDRAAGAAARAWRDASLGCTGSPEEVAGIVRLLASLASQAAAPPNRTATGYCTPALCLAERQAPRSVDELATAPSPFFWSSSLTAMGGTSASR